MKDGGIIIPDSAVEKQVLHFRDSPDLVILGKGDSRHDGVKIAQDKQCECWGLNDIERFPELTMLFELHDWDDRVKKYNPLHLETHGLPVMMKDRYPDVPNAVRFPMKKIIDEFPAPYFNNQVCEILAFAIMTKRFKNIYLFGVDYNSSERPEQEFERPCTEFWIGYALAAGMNVFISPQSNLLTYCGYHKGIIYGYTPNYQKPFEGFNAAQPHYWAEYILGAFGGRAIPKETYSHEEWMSELNKFTVQYVHEKCRQKMEMDKANAKKKETTGTREGQAEATSS